MGCAAGNLIYGRKVAKGALDFFWVTIATINGIAISTRLKVFIYVVVEC
jgi:hypothetical protein